MKKIIAKKGKVLFEKTLFQIRKLLVEKRLDPSRDSVLISWATYSPWLLDEEFQACHRIVRDYTLVDIYRCYELWHLLGQVREVPGDILEVGTWRGGTGGILARRARLLGISSPIYLCDTFTGVVKTGSQDTYYSGGEHDDTSAPVVEEMARKLGVDNIRILNGIFPEDTGHLLEDSRFRFCHIDVDVYQSGKDVLHWVWPRLETGGVVVFDDFGFSSTPGITQLVQEEQDAPDRVCVQNLNGHAVFVKTR